MIAKGVLGLGASKPPTETSGCLAQIRSSGFIPSCPVTLPTQFYLTASENWQNVKDGIRDELSKGVFWNSLVQPIHACIHTYCGHSIIAGFLSRRF